MKQRAELAESATREAAQTLNPQSKIAKLDIAVSELRALAEYEGKGIKTPVEAARLRLDRTSAERDALILRTAREDAAETIEKLSSMPRPGEKLKFLEGFRTKLTEYRRRCGDGRSIDILERRVKTTAYRIRLSARLDEAEAAEKEKKTDDAKSLFEEALAIMDKEGKTDPSYKKQRDQILKRLK